MDANDIKKGGARARLLPGRSKKTIEQYQKPLRRSFDLALFFLFSFPVAFGAFVSQGEQAKFAVKGLSWIFTTEAVQEKAESVFKIASPVPLMSFSMLNSYELAAFLVQDPESFWETLCKSKLRILMCLAAAVTSGYVASESTSNWLCIAASLFSSLMTNSSFFIFREPYMSHKDELIGTANWMVANGISLSEGGSGDDQPGTYGSTSDRDAQTRRFQLILKNVLKNTKNYLSENTGTNCGVNTAAWMAFILPNFVYLASAASAGSWIFSGMPKDRSGSKINGDNLSNHPWGFIAGMLISGLCSYWINGKVNFLSTHRLAEEARASKLDPWYVKYPLGLASLGLSISYIFFNFGLNLNNPLFETECVKWPQAVSSLFIVPLTFFSLYALPRKMWKIVVTREKQNTDADDLAFFLDTMGRVPSVILAEMVAQISAKIAEESDSSGCGNSSGGAVSADDASADEDLEAGDCCCLSLFGNSVRSDEAHSALNEYEMVPTPASGETPTERAERMAANRKRSEAH